MGVKERIIDWLGAVPAGEIEALQTRINEAYEAGFYDGNDDPATSVFKQGGQNYRRLSDNYIREGKVDYKRAIETAWEVWQKNLLFKRILEIKRDHIIGHNAMPSATDDDINEIVQAFWDDNKMGKRSREFTMQLYGFGEQCFPAFVRESDGRVRLGYIDPTNILKVCQHPDNSMEDWAIVTETIENHIQVKRVYRIIRKDEDYADDSRVVASQYEGKLVTAEQATIQPWESELLAQYGRPAYDGSCFFTKINAVSNQPRGMSDLLQAIDWMEQDDEVLFALAERENFAGYFSFDVTLTNADDEKTRDRSKAIRNEPPGRGAVNVHNDSEEWQMFAPNLGQTGSIETFRAILGFILGGRGLPVHWYGFGDDANRATALAQGDPIARSLENDQDTVKDMFFEILQFAIDQAEIAGTLTSYDEDYELLLELPEISSKDLSRTTSSLAQLVQALALAEDRGYQAHETTVKVWAKMLGELGIEVDPASEMEMIDAEQEEAELEEEQRRNTALNAQLNGQNGQQMTPAQMAQMLGIDADA